MNSAEIRNAMNEFDALYPYYFKGISQERLNSIASSWERLYEDVSDYEAFIQGMYDFKSNSESSSPPTAKELIASYRNAKIRADLKKGVNGLRIVTEDEVMYELYLAELKKEPSKRNEDLIRRCLPSAKIMTDESLFRKKYGREKNDFMKMK